ncbi:MAG: tRNA 5-methoxyuridine(34)/uridine 5-oxyacetic acid(34) synthase CmoB [Kistimonas sp.]|nr:tRNA 5-methoxyuridine(34)/uridine 5-oxyacetic acid(34) synthase CmoB [Kistimonas sp.]
MILADLPELLEAMTATNLEPWQASLAQQVHKKLAHPHGDMPVWIEALKALPQIAVSQSDLAVCVPSARCAEPLSADCRTRLRRSLQALCPWRKGPFDLFGEYIDAEWRSDWKWKRLHSHIAPLKGRLVLDVGCGCGYHMWRMWGEGASRVLGVDPSRLFLVQFEALKRYLGPAAAVHLLPLAMEDIPRGLHAFDTVFSMGVLSHRKDPVDHIRALHEALRPGGELVLETLVTQGPAGSIFQPPGRYAMMRNVWSLPTPGTLEYWLQKSGFSHIRVVDINRTSPTEQRTTAWMPFRSLQDFLDPQDSTRTVEGWPAPLRATVLATA